MNERIKELEAQAAKYATTSVADVCQCVAEYESKWDKKFREEFALLIVRECAEMMPQDNLYKMVLKRFGVE
jgi:hypothetical protein